MEQMTLEQAKQEFIQAWGGLGSNWGINKTMAQIHALMLVSEEALSTEDVMDALMISRGNANMNLRALVDWNLVRRTAVMGERREYFVAEKDTWRTATRIAHERRKRELEPMLKTLDHLVGVEIRSEDKNKAREFKAFLKDLQGFASKVDYIFGAMTKADKQWFSKKLLKLFLR
jgi:DNA-binding transcriptional regulator GbsR (MarR family)